MTSLPTIAPQAPVADWVTIPNLYADPFPIYERLRSEGGVHWVPAVNRYLITSYEAVSATEHDQVTFSANEEGSLQIRAMGHSMLRRDDPDHYVERRAWQPTLKPGVVKRVWTEIFREVAQQQLAELIAKGPGADLIWDFAAPYAAESLRRMLGFYNVDQSDLQRWSQTMIDATGNYADDPAVWAAGEKSYAEVDEALDEMLEHHLRHRDDSMISSLLSLPGELMPLEKIRANMKMTIGGGLNEPRDALGVAAWALMTHPEQRAAVMDNPGLWPTVFEETIRWIAPIGMYSRQVTTDTVLAGTALPKSAKLGICVLSANRDSTIWSHPEAFDIHREVKPHLAFSKGVHVCLGSWAARAQIAEVALPLLFNSLDGLTLAPNRTPAVGGWVFRGMLDLPVVWKKASTYLDYGPMSKSSVTTAGQKEAQVSAGIGEGRSPRLAVVGAGPAGCFAAKEVLRHVPGARIDVFDRLPVPFGLLRYGVAADHQGTKSVSAQFDRLFADDRVNFIGNTRIGTDIMMDELRAEYDAVVLASGLDTDRPLAIPGSALDGVHGAGSLTRLLNSHPDEAAEVPHLGGRTTVIGHGNVAVDLVRLLTADEKALEGSDINDIAHRAMSENITRIDVVGRSEAGKAKFDPVMIRELARTPGLRHVLHGVELNEIPIGKDAKLDALRQLTDAADAEATATEVHWWFETVPQAILDGGESESVIGIEVEHAGEILRLDTDSVVSAIGFVRCPVRQAWQGICPVSPIPAHGKIADGLFAIGWLKGNGRGTIPDQRTDAKALATLIAAEVASGTITSGSGGIAPGDRATDYTGWRRIDLRERLGAGPGRARAKIADPADLLLAARDSSLDSQLETTSSAVSSGLGAPVPVSVLFGTESGNAELVAEELGSLMGRVPGVQIADLATLSPADLSPERFHLIVCSTYGDGEVPSSAKAFYRTLRETRPDLGGVRFAMFGMGDASYTKTYSRGSELLTERLEACGATRVGEYGRHDAGGTVPASEAAFDWAEGILSNLSAEVIPA